MSLACIYALANSIIGLTTGGHEVKAGPALVWAAVLCVGNLGMAAFVAEHGYLDFTSHVAKIGRMRFGASQRCTVRR
ncbi:hypothetical protein [Stenotrophomonas rhizophila]|uniref:hypothetical protein n=1 Tax=Stenotrophomonas rhizophila TaxID=216778 RepID=UPI001E52988E|nr:hypothetical protein [Stenotrophomonas rhizophila]